MKQMSGDVTLNLIPMGNMTSNATLLTSCKERQLWSCRNTALAIPSWCDTAPSFQAYFSLPLIRYHTEEALLPAPGLGVLVISTRRMEAAGHSHVVAQYFIQNDSPASSGKATVSQLKEPWRNLSSTRDQD